MLLLGLLEIKTEIGSSSHMFLANDAAQDPATTLIAD